MPYQKGQTPWNKRPATERFWEKVNKTKTCWLWIACKNKAGYGSFNGGEYAHRFSYEELVGEIPKGLQIDHLCRVRHCVNPKHLEAVTNQVNGQRGNSAKLVVSDVEKIKAYLRIGWSDVDIAKMFIVSAHTIGKIKNNQRWQNV